MSKPVMMRKTGTPKKSRWSKKGRDTRTIEELTEAELRPLADAKTLPSDDQRAAELAAAARQERAQKLRELEQQEMPEEMLEEPEPEQQLQLEAEFAEVTSAIDQLSALESRLGALEQQRQHRHAEPEPEREKLSGQPLVLSESFIDPFDGEYKFVDHANGKPHWENAQVCILKG